MKYKLTEDGWMERADKEYVKKSLRLLALKGEVLGLMIWGMYSFTKFASVRWGI